MTRRWRAGWCWKRDAILFAVGCNGTHGLPRTNEDKRNALEILLASNAEAGETWTNRQIAKQCAVSHEFVRQFIGSLATVASDNQNPAKKKFIDRWGNESEMDTSKISEANTLRTLASEIGEDDESPKPSKQYINGDTGEDSPPLQRWRTISTQPISRHHPAPRRGRIAAVA